MPDLERRPRGRRRPTAGDFQKVTLDDNTQNPMELDIAPDGRVFYIERDGRLMIWKPDTRQTVTGGQGPGHASARRTACSASQLAPDFAFSKWVYLFYSQLPDNTLTQVISRFKVNGDTLDLVVGAEDPDVPAPDRPVLPLVRARCTSVPDGSLYVSTGDNTNPFDSDGYNPIDEQPGREYWDAQRTSANTNDLNGKILRIKPMEIPLGPARRRHDLHDPGRQPLPRAGTGTRPGRRSSAWASATRSASRSTRPRAGC